MEEIFGDLGLDFETFALLLGVAGAAATALLASTILGQGKKKRDFSTEPWYMIFLINLAEYVNSGKKVARFRNSLLRLNKIKRA